MCEPIAGRFYPINKRKEENLFPGGFKATMIHMTTEEQLFKSDIRKKRKNETYMSREKFYRIIIH